MSEIYTVIVGILGILAVSGLFVGVTNDAVNFLNSAIGSKAASMKIILTVASVGIIIGVVTSSGMMEVARSGMFNPGLFTFHEVMMLYLGVMFANVILLDLSNSWGLPTSTTVSLIFCLLGAAIAVSIYKISNDPDQSVSSLGHYINTSRAMGIVSAILLSVVIAFTCGTLVMYVSRMIFSFRYTALFRRYGSLWCGASLTAIVYFAVFKGLKSILADHAFIQLIDNHLPSAIAICWVVCSLLLFFIQRFKVNILRITILSGTFALALAFAGNDLVNFIGVPVAGFDAYTIAREAGDTQMLMGALNENVPANFLILLTAGILMILTLWTSKKAMHVSETELSLSAQDDAGQQQYGSSVFSRTIVRAALNVSAGIERVVPKHLRESISRRFEYEDVEHSGAPYDMIRATVNLTTSALLIAMATSLKLPLSTTYVTFMVAMGSSLADKAWGRESAVYRITGVVTVIAGWFVTALIAFVIALVVTYALLWGGTWDVIIISLLCVGMFIQSSITHKRRKAKEHKTEEIVTASGNSTQEVMRNLIAEISGVMTKTTEIYSKTIMATLNEDRRTLREMVRESNDLFYNAREKKYALLPTLQKLQDNYIEAGHFYVQVVDYISEMSKALVHITRPCFEHIDNNHKGMSEEQVEDLLKINDKVSEIYARINVMLNDNDYSDTNVVLEMRDELFVTIDDAVKSQLRRIQNKATSTKASMLYLTILNETKTMVLQSRNLLKSQRSFMENQDTSNDLMGNK